MEPLHAIVFPDAGLCQAADALAGVLNALDAHNLDGDGEERIDEVQVDARVAQALQDPNEVARNEHQYPSQAIMNGTCGSGGNRDSRLPKLPQGQENR